MVENMGVGDTIGFEVHMNAKMQPQASTGTVVQLAAAARSMEDPASADAADSQKANSRNVGMDATVYAPGRVVMLNPDDDEISDEELMVPTESQPDKSAEQVAHPPPLLAYQ